MPLTRVPAVKGMSHVGLDWWADRLLQQHFPAFLDRAGPLPIRDLLDIVLPRHYGIDTGIDVLPAGVEGICEPPDVLLIREEVYDGLDANGHHRFTGAHEATHAIVHIRQVKEKFESTGGARLYRRVDIQRFEDPEWQANRGAEALLMPARIIVPFIKEHGPDPFLISRTFGVSVECAGYRIDHFQRGQVAVIGARG